MRDRGKTLAAPSTAATRLPAISPACFCLAAVMLAALPAAAQTMPGLRGSEVPPELAVKGRTSLPVPELGLRKPDGVTRIRAAPLAPPLPAEDDAPAAADTFAPTAPAAIASPVLDSQTEEARRRRAADAAEDPYDALGVRAGAFLLKPSIEVDFGYDSNPGQQPGKVEGASFVELTPRLDFTSDWSRHLLKGTIDGGFTHYFGIEDANRPSLDAVIDGRLDVTRDLSVEGQARLFLDTERIGSDGVPTTATKRPLTEQFGGTLGIVRHFGDAALSLRGSIDRNDYEEITPGEQRDYTTYGTALRGTYDISPAVRPFVEVSADTRRYDDVAAMTASRDSDGAAARAGGILEFTGKLTGQASLGYGMRDYDDPALQTIGGILADASLVWTASALTKVTLRASTDFNETTVPGSSGYVTRIAGLEVEHAFRRNLIGTATASLTRDLYDGVPRTDDTIEAGLGIEYRLTRSVAVKAKYTYEHLASTVPGTDYTANSIMVGLKMQP